MLFTTKLETGLNKINAIISAKTNDSIFIKLPVNPLLYPKKMQSNKTQRSRNGYL